MAEKKRAAGRPTEANTRRHPVMVRLNDAELAGFNRLIAARNDDLRGENVTLKGPDVLRWLIAREVVVRGLDGKGS